MHFANKKANGEEKIQRFKFLISFFGRASSVRKAAKNSSFCFIQCVK